MSETNRPPIPHDHIQAEAQPGTYVLILSLAVPLALTVGRLGTFTLAPGRYAYVGSAHGPGGLRARVNRHLRQEKRLHWHIDYLTAALPIQHVYAVASAQKLECAWVRRLLALPGASVPIPGFGSSDCHEGCPAHLVRLPDDYGLEQLENALETVVHRQTESNESDTPQELPR